MKIVYSKQLVFCAESKNKAARNKKVDNKVFESEEK